MPELRLKVPACSLTTCPEGQAEIAELICAAVALELNVEQIVVRLGIPPVTPAWDQSIARLGSTIPDQGWALKDPLPASTATVKRIDRDKFIVISFSNRGPGRKSDFSQRANVELHSRNSHPTGAWVAVQYCQMTGKTIRRASTVGVLSRSDKPSFSSDKHLNPGDFGCQHRTPAGVSQRAGR